MADNLDRRKVMLGAQTFMLVVSVASGALRAGWDSSTPWLLLLFTFLIGCGTAFNAPAWQASVGDMVPRAELPGAVALNSMGFNIARSLGPAIGGADRRGSGRRGCVRGQRGELHLPLIVVLLRWRPPAQSAGTASRDARHRCGRWHSLRRRCRRHSHRSCPRRSRSASARAQSWR